MLQRVSWLFIGTMLALMLLVGGVSTTNASAATLSTMSGKLYSVNYRTKQVTLATSTGHLTLTYNTTTRFVRNGVLSSPKGLVLRDSTLVKYDATTNSVYAVRATGPAATVVTGRVLNRVQRSGVVALGTGRVRTTARTALARNGNPTSLGQLTRRDTALVHVAAGTNIALDVQDDGPEDSSVDGTITAIAGNSVTITPDDGSAAVTVTADTNTLISLNDAPATLASLQLGMTAESEYDPATMIALTIDAEAEGEELEVDGTVASVDTTNNKITINPSDGSAPVTLNVNASTEIEVNDEDATLADVQTGMDVQAEYDSVTMNATQIEASAAGSGGGD